MQPDNTALCIMWSVWGVAAFVVALAVVVNRRRIAAWADFLRRRRAKAGEGGHA